MKFPTAVEDSVNHKNDGRGTKIFLNRNDEFYGLLLETDFLDGEDVNIPPMICNGTEGLNFYV